MVLPILEWWVFGWGAAHCGLLALRGGCVAGSILIILKTTMAEMRTARAVGPYRWGSLRLSVFGEYFLDRGKGALEREGLLQHRCLFGEIELGKDLLGVASHVDDFHFWILF